MFEASTIAVSVTGAVVWQLATIRGGNRHRVAKVERDAQINHKAKIDPGETRCKIRTFERRREGEARYVIDVLLPGLAGFRNVVNGTPRIDGDSVLLALTMASHKGFQTIAGQAGSVTMDDFGAFRTS